MESMVLFNELEVHEDSLNRDHFFLCVLINLPPHSNGRGRGSQMKGNFQYFTGNKKIFLQQLASLTHFWKEIKTHYGVCMSNIYYS